MSLLKSFLGCKEQKPIAESISFNKNMTQRWEEEFYNLAKSTFDKILDDEKIYSEHLSTTLAIESVKAGQEYKLDLEQRYKASAKISSSVTEKKSQDVLFVTSIFPSVLHGGGIRIFDIMYELSQRGHNVSLFTLDHNVDDYSKESLHNFCHELYLVSPEKFSKTTLLEWSSKVENDFRATYFVWPSTSDLVICDDKKFGRAIFEFIECTTLRLWMDIKQCLIEDREVSREMLFGFWRDYFWESTALAKCHEYVCVGPKDRDFINLIHQANREKFHILSTGISQTQILNKLDTKKQDQIPHSAGFIGNYAHYPNLDGLVWYFDHVHGRILDKVENYKFYVFGMGDIEELKENYSHFNSSVEWVGPVDCVVEALLPMGLMLCPIVSGAGLRGKIIQYASLKKPIVSTEIGAWGTPFKDQHSIVITSDADKFSKAVILAFSANNCAFS